MWDCYENLIYKSLLLIAVLKQMYNFLCEVIQSNSKVFQVHSITLQHKKSKIPSILGCLFFLVKNPISMPLLPVIISLNHNDILRIDLYFENITH